jgi:hypothetical protein
MIPRAAVIDPSPLAAPRRALRPLAWWRSRVPGWFLIGHCATAGALQLGALVIDLLRAGGPVPAAATLTWAWLGLAVVATIPGMITMLAQMLSPPRARRDRILQTVAIGAGFYAVMPLLILTGSIGPIAVLIPVAVLWHTALAAAPPTRLPSV